MDQTNRKHAAILEAAAKVFAGTGYDRCSMDQIAEVAHVSKRTVYNHFASKELLLEEVIKRLVEDTQALKRIPYDAKLPLALQLARFADAILALTRNETWLGLMKVIASHPALTEQALALVKNQEDTMVVWLRDGIADGRLQAENPERAAGAFWSMLFGAFLMPAIFAQPLPTEATNAMQRELIEIFLARYAC